MSATLAQAPEITKETFALMVSAANISDEVRAAHEHSSPVVVRAAKHLNALASAQAAFLGQQYEFMGYQLITLKAEHGIHGGRLTGSNFPFHADPAETEKVYNQFREAADLGLTVQVVVVVNSSVELDDLYAGPVISDLRQQLDYMAEQNDVHLSNYSVVWIIQDQQKN